MLVMPLIALFPAGGRRSQPTRRVFCRNKAGSYRTGHKATERTGDSGREAGPSPGRSRLPGCLAEALALRLPAARREAPWLGAPPAEISAADSLEAVAHPRAFKPFTARPAPAPLRGALCHGGATARPFRPPYGTGTGGGRPASAAAPGASVGAGAGRGEERPP